MDQSVVVIRNYNNPQLLLWELHFSLNVPSVLFFTIVWNGMNWVYWYILLLKPSERCLIMAISKIFFSRNKMNWVKYTRSSFMQVEKNRAHCELTKYFKTYQSPNHQIICLFKDSMCGLQRRKRTRKEPLDNKLMWQKVLSINKLQHHLCIK